MHKIGDTNINDPCYFTPIVFQNQSIIIKMIINNHSDCTPQNCVVLFFSLCGEGGLNHTIVSCF